MNFIEAMKLAREGKKITRPTWQNDHYIGGLCDEEGLFCANVESIACDELLFSYDDILSTDWIIEE